MSATIRKQDIRDLYPLTPMQEGMLFRWLYDRESTAYFEQLSVTIDDAFDRVAFEAACRELFRRHDVLRTVFLHENASRPLQVVLKEWAPAIRFEDLRHLDAEEQERYLDDWKSGDRLRGFDLTDRPPVRIALFRLGDARHVLVWSHHHILMDGWCLAVLHSELGALYAGKTLPPARPFGAYVRWLEGQDSAAAKRFWSESLAGCTTTALAGRASSGIYELIEHDIEFDDATIALLRTRCAEARITPSTLVHALWGVLLGKYNDTRDVVFGSVLSNRPEEIDGIETIVGLFINTLPVRVVWDGDTTFADLLRRVHEHVVARKPHEFLPLADIQSGGALFDHLMLVQNYPVDANGNLNVSSSELFEHTEYPFTINVVLGDGLRIRFAYDGAVFPTEQVASYEHQLRHLLGILLADPHRAIATIPLLPACGEKVPQADEGPPPPDANFLDLYDAAVRRHPHRIAVTFEDRSLTYEQLDQLANEIANTLNIKPGALVPLIEKRSERMLASMLAIIKAGGAYVAIDPSFPEERKRWLVEQCEGEATEGLIYVAFTSGSTGRPKGVMIEHRNVAAFTPNLATIFGLDESDRILALTTFTFDISVLELLCSLAHGMHVVIASDEVASDPRSILEEIEKRDITVLQVTPSRLSTLVDAGGWEALERLRVILVGGEPMPPDVFDGLRALRNPRAFNVYGPTETTIWSTALQIGNGPLTAGVPLPGESIVILSQEGHPVPPGVAGEVCIGGTGLGRGYLGRDDLTRERYITHNGRRLYRTGDVGRLRTDGQLELLGRRDDQVKIRGFRVELGEIEAALRAIPGVRQAAVAVRGKELVGYVNVGRVLQPAELRAVLERTLPAYMIPSRFVLLDRIPLLPSGKTDRKALPEPTEIAGAEVATPRDAIERALLAVWSSVLGRDSIGIFDDFFTIGGHSLKATQLLGRIHRDLHADVRMRELFAAPTIAAVAALIRAKSPAALEPLQPIPDADSYELSAGERRMWILDRIAADRMQYVMPVALRIEGPLDAAALQRALDALAARHESLRTIFPMMEGEPRQVVLPPSPFPLDGAESIATIAMTFDLERGPIARAWLIPVAPREHVFVFAMHHIIGDGLSLQVLMRDLSRLFSGAKLEPLRIQYRDFAAWQNRLIAGEAGEAASRYWREKFAGEIEPLDVPIDHPRPPLSDPRGASVACTLTRAQCSGLARLAREHHASTFMLAVALVKTLLRRYTGAEDIVVGTPIAGRMHPDLRNQSGIFLNTLALRDAIRGDATFADVLAAVRQTVLDAFDHQLYPFDRLVDELGARRDPSRTPLFDVLVTMENEDPEQLRLGDLRVTPFPLDARLTRFDLTFSFAELKDGLLALQIDYRTALFTPTRMERLAAHVSKLVDTILADHSTAIDDIDLVTRREAEMIAAFNDTRRDFDAEKTIVEAFDEQVARTPDRVAVVDGIHGARELTYRELQSESMCVAAQLGALEPDQRVGLRMARSADAIIAMLGILRAGGAYVPLDPAYPEARIDALIAEAECEVVLDARSPTRPLETLRTGSLTRPGGSEAPPYVAGARNLAYVLFTSGTTGRPKGVMIEHRSVINLAAFFDALEAPLGEGLRESAAASLMFDVSVQETFCGLLRGNTLHVIDDDVKRDPRALGDYLIRHRIQVFAVTPSILAAMLEAGVAIEVQQINIGAEVLTKALLDQLFARAPNVRVCQLYGPTECCVDSTYLPIVPGAYDRDVSVPIGRPLPNARIHVVDAQLRPVPIGIAGEICIGGVGVGRGYLDREGAFVDTTLDPDGRVYRTGDLGAWRDDGTIQFLGRRDQQVKVRGHRVEPGEIEQQLASIDGIRNVAIDARKSNDGTTELVAYLVGDADPADVRRELAKRVPSYMVPAYFVPIEQLPMTASGKLDRRALPDPRAMATDINDSPADDLEAAVLRIWKEVLGRDAIGINENFFEAGGHSLKAVRVVNRIRDAFGCDLTLGDFFAAPTVAQLAAAVKPRSAAAMPPPSAPVMPHYPLTHAQRRLWVLSHLDPTRIAYNISSAYRIEGDLDVPKLEAALTAVVARHESLRTSFPMIDGEPRQVIHPNVGRVLQPALDVPFELATGPLFRASLTDDVLVLTLHHIIADAWSLDILLREIAAFYRGDALPPLAFQAKDFAWHESVTPPLGRDYWLEKLSGDIPPLELPIDFPRPAVRSYRGRIESFDLPAAPLEALAKSHGATLYAALVATVKILLHRYSGQSDIVIGSAVAGRASRELEEQIGFYVHTVALRDSIESGESFGDIVAKVSRTIGEALAHVDYPFDLLVDELHLRRDTSRAPLFDVMLTFGRNEPIGADVDGLRVTPLPAPMPISKFDLSFHFEKSDDALRGAIEYNTDIFSAARIARMIAHLSSLVATGGAELLPDAEREQIITFSRGPSADVPPLSIAERFAAQAAATPDNLAVIGGGESWTYRELNTFSTKLARSLALHPREPVLVQLDRTPAAIAVLLAVFKAGGVYVPVDPQCPPLRLEQVMSETGCRVVIAKSGFVRRDLEPRPIDGAAYVIFTSGSTGVPKGVVVGDLGFVNMALRQIETFGITPDDRVVQFASPAFDASLSEIFMALFAGAALVLVDRDTIADGARFLRFLDDAHVTVATLPPSYLNALGRPPLATLKVLITAGEPPVASDARHYAQRLRYFNAYGPTESSVCATIHEVRPGDTSPEIPIGRPLANTSIHVLCEQRPAPIAVPGEIFIGGIGLAIGYLGDREPDRFVMRDGERLYRTGDRGWWREDGELVYAGRLDDQVKINGQRIEPAEVTRALEACDGVSMAYVIPRDGRLVAYLQGASRSGLREELALTLPPAMIPSHFIWLDSFPRNTSGKIDKDALPAPEERAMSSGDAPRDDVEAQLADAWRRVLRVSHVGIHDHFFEAGGDSIKLLQVAAELHARGLHVDIADVYRHPTIASLAAHVTTAAEGAPQGPVTGLAPLASTQAWFFETSPRNRDHFNQSVLLRTRGRIDPDALRQALHDLAMHHDALRVRFRAIDGVMQQEFLAEPHAGILEVIDDDVTEEHAQRVQRSLDIAEGRVFAAALFRDHLFLVAHHLVVDGVSWRILLQDLSAGLAHKPFPRKTHSFKHWAEQQHLALKSLQDEVAYWRSIDAPLIESNGARSTEHIALTVDETRALLRAGRTDAVLLAALARAFARCGRRMPLVVLEGHGREETVSRTVGWFTSMYPVDLTGAEQAAAVARVLDAVPNRGAGYGILAWLGHRVEHDLSHAMAFNFLGDVDHVSDDPFFEPELTTLGDAIDPELAALHAFDFTARVSGGVLSADLTSDDPRLAEQFALALREPVPAFPHVQRAVAEPLLLNAAQPQAIFAMPPLFGYGSAFRTFASHIRDHALYSFDFIEDDDRIEQYADGILARANGCSVLLGYSGGGNLAFEVAKELTRRGHEVRDLVLFDAPLRLHPIAMTDAEVEEMMEGNLGYFRKRMEDDPEYRIFATNPQMKRLMLRKMESFIRYLNSLVNGGSIAGDIHLVRSAQQWATPEEWDEWAERTSGRFLRYQGAGDHADMTDDRHVAANAAIVNAILARVTAGIA